MQNLMLLILKLNELDFCFHGRNQQPDICLLYKNMAFSELKEEGDCIPVKKHSQIY